MTDPVFVSYAREDAMFALALADRLRVHGVPVWVDLWEIAPGDDWDRAIDRGLKACARFLIVLSPSAVASEEVRAELRSALNGHKPIVPVLYRPCDVPRQLLNIQYFDFSAAESPDESLVEPLVRTLRRNGAMEDLLPAHGASPTSLAPDAPMPGTPAYRTRRELRNRRDVLDDVRTEVAGRLARSVRAGCVLAIPLEWQPHRVTPAWEVEVAASRSPQPHLPPGGIVQAFDERAIGGRLLILGSPGSGKTTTLLELAGVLAARAERSIEEPIPVLLNLSSWRGDRATLGNWLVSELKAKYGVREDHGATWRDERVLIPLLDGLDELPSAWQDDCVRAINEFQLAYRPPRLVVCCRVDEYANLSTTLQLNGAVRLVPLAEPQIAEYLACAGRGHVWNDIQTNASSMELARSPLLLDLMSSLDQPSREMGSAPPTPSGATGLMEAYVQARLTREAPAGRYSPGQTLHWLSRLAAILTRQGQTEFLLERVEPDWLLPPSRQRLYRVGVALLTTAVVTCVLEPSGWLLEVLPRGPLTLALNAAYPMSGLSSVVVSAAFGAIAGVIVSTRPAVVPIETLSWSWSTARAGARTWSRTGLWTGLDYGFRGGIVAGGLVATLDILHVVRVSGGLSIPPQMARWGWTGVGLGTALGVLGSVAVASIRPSGAAAWWRSWPAGAGAAAVSVGIAIIGIVVSLTGGVLLGVLTALAFALVQASPALDHRSRVGFAQTLVVGATATLVAAPIAYGVSGGSPSIVEWLVAFSLTALAGSLVMGTARAGRARLAPLADSNARGGSIDGLLRALGRGAAVGLVGGIALAIVAGLLSRAGHFWLVRGLAMVAVYQVAAFMLIVLQPAAFGLAFGASGAVTAGLLGGLIGALSGLRGHDVERRREPNQGIRQSAWNVAVFAALGTLVVGLPFALFNITAGALTMRTWPTGADWVRFGAVNAVTFGGLAGLIPGAACLQHYTLRGVLWWDGAAPWRYRHFLDFATDRRLLQRVGGRYRFVHALLRDHLARSAPS